MTKAWACLFQPSATPTFQCGWLAVNPLCECSATAGVGGGPQPCGSSHRSPGDQGQDDGRCRKPERRPRPPSERIGQEPAGMPEGELGGEQRRAILRVRGTP